MTTPVTTPFAVSLTSSMTLSHTKQILGCASALSCMIREARSSLRRCTTVTCETNFVKNTASSMAVSPPPTTTIGFSRKK